MTRKQYLFLALLLGFTFVTMVAYKQARPISKPPIYKVIKKYSPFYIDKRFGGLEILSKTDENFKEKPSNMEVFHRLDSLEKEWGKKHLKLENDRLVIFDDNNQSELDSFPISKEDAKFIHNFFGI